MKLTKFEIMLIKNGQNKDPKQLLQSLKNVSDGGGTEKWDIKKVKLAANLSKRNLLDTDTKL